MIEAVTEYSELSVMVRVTLPIERVAMVVSAGVSSSGIRMCSYVAAGRRSSRYSRRYHSEGEMGGTTDGRQKHSALPSVGMRGMRALKG